ncbi:transposase [Kineobactrum salinum]|uniref:Transposase n=1 Tax=Kineobactrum salinum TaxID=2708301 RepID=A0A6C0TWV5_9GAMM|nr:transposase [Kineobactrum salinum]
MAKSVMGERPLSCHLFVFINRCQTQIKIKAPLINSVAPQALPCQCAPEAPLRH